MMIIFMIRIDSIICYSELLDVAHCIYLNIPMSSEHTLICTKTTFIRLPWQLRGKESVCDAGDMGDAGSISGLGRSLGRGNYKPLQYTCLGNPMDRGARWVTVQGVAKS